MLTFEYKIFVNISRFNNAALTQRGLAHIIPVFCSNVNLTLISYIDIIEFLCLWTKQARPSLTVLRIMEKVIIVLYQYYLIR